MRAFRHGLTLDHSIYLIGAVWIPAANLVGVDANMRPFNLSISVEDAKLILDYAEKAEREYRESETVLAGADRSKED